MALMTWNYDGTRVTEAGSTTDYSLFTGLSYSGLPENIKVKRCYWQWTVSRSSGSVYARWYEQGNSSNKGSAGANGTFTFDVALVTATSGNPKVYLGSQYGKSTYSNISFNIEFDYLQSSLTLSTTNVNAGASITANITAQNAEATHKVTFQFGTRTQSYTMAAGVASQSFSVPLEWLDQIPSAVSGTASCKLDTIAGSTTVGSETLNFTINAPSSVVPTISSLTATRVNNSVPSSWGLYVQGQSGATVTCKAAGAHGSTISSYQISGGGATANASTLTVNALPSSGTITFTAKVTDSRGRTATKTASISVVAWSSPVVREASVIRCDDTGGDDPTGTSLLVSLEAVVASVSGKNTATATLSYRQKGVTSWTSAVTGAPSGGPWVIAAGQASQTQAYEVRIVLADAFASETYTLQCATAKCFLDEMPGRRRYGVGGYCATDNTFYIAPDMAPRWGEKSLVPAPRNLLDNSWWGQRSEIVNQRGQTNYGGTADAPAIDRWILPNAKVSASIGADCINVTNADTTNRTIMQRTTALTGYDGPVTAAVCLADGTILCGSCVNDSADTSGRQSLWEVGSGTVGAALYGYDGYKGLGIIVKNGKTVKLRWAALYKGSYIADTLPEYVPKGYAAELAECMRYFERKHYQVFAGSADTDMFFSVPFSPKRLVNSAITAVTSRHSDNITPGVVVWYTTADNAAGEIVYQGKPAGAIAYWYGYFDISADL